MKTFTKIVTHSTLLALGLVVGAGYGIAAYFEETAAALSGRISYDEWRLPLAVVTGLVWAASAVWLGYNIAGRLVNGRRVAGAVPPMIGVPMLMMLVTLPIERRHPMLKYLLFGFIESLLVFGWSYGLNKQRRNEGSSNR